MSILHLIEFAHLSEQQRLRAEERRRAADEILKRNILLWEREAAEEEGDAIEDVDGVAIRIRWRNPNLAPEDKPHAPDPPVKSLSDLAPVPHAERPDVAVHHAHHSAHDSILQVEDLTLNH